MRPTFIVNNRNKQGFVGTAVAGALSQTVPCEILISDFKSTDKSTDEIKRAIDESPRGASHDVRFVTCPLHPAQTMQSVNEHFDWMVSQTKGEWIFQSSSDDYSLPDRVRVCMEAVENHPCSVVATTMWFEKPGEAKRQARSGFPTETGYVKPGEGLLRLAYGSVIAAYHRDFLTRVGNGGPNTLDVYYGFMAALDKGFYVVCDQQHVHVEHESVNNIGFQGKMRGAGGDDLLRLAELNHFQLLQLYDGVAECCKRLHPDGINPDDWDALLNMIFGQAKGWLEARKVLHAKGVTPGVL